MSRPKPTPDPDQDAKISVLYQTGHSATQIARRLKIGISMVDSALKRAGTPRRSISEAQRLRSGWY